MRILRNIFRRKLRAFLTIFGISIGVFALVVMGAIAEKLTLLVDGGMKYYAGKVVIVPKAKAGSHGRCGTALNRPCCARSSTSPASRAVSAEVSALLTTETIAVNFGPPATIRAGRTGDGLRDVRGHVRRRAAS